MLLPEWPFILLINNYLFLYRFLQSTIGGLHPTQPSVVRVSAIRSVYSYCTHFKSVNNPQVLAPFLPNVMDGLLSVATQFSSDVLSLCLESIAVVLSVSIFQCRSYFLFITTVVIEPLSYGSHNYVCMQSVPTHHH